MTDANGQIISLQIGSDERPFFTISHDLAGKVREVLTDLGFEPYPTNAGQIALLDMLNSDDEGDEIIAFDKGVDPDALQDILDELSWAGNRVIREVVA